MQPLTARRAADYSWIAASAASELEGCASRSVRHVSPRGVGVVETGGGECGDGRIVLDAGHGLHLLGVRARPFCAAASRAGIELVSEAMIGGQRGYLSAVASAAGSLMDPPEVVDRFTAGFTAGFGADIAALVGVVAYLRMPAARMTDPAVISPSSEGPVMTVMPSTTVGG
jgi:hypothetical protein